MSGSPALANQSGSDLHEIAKEILVTEIDEITQISLTLVKSLGFLKNRLKTPFPKKCTKCSAVYETFEDFYYGTQEIARGTVSYPILGNDFYLHRNCRPPCETTLVVVFVDRRDESIAGARRRALFEQCLVKLNERFGLDHGAARDVLLTLLANELSARAQNGTA